MKYFFLLPLLAAFQLAKIEPVSYPTPQNNFSCDAVKNKLFKLFVSIDSIKNNEDKNAHRDDLIDTLNQKIIRTLRELTINNRYTYCNLNTPYKLGYLLSADHKLCIISWDSRNGGTETDYRTAVIYKTDSLTKMEILNGDAPAKTYFDSLFTVINSAGETYYVADGFSRESDKLITRKVKAFQVTNMLTDSLQVFPESEGSPGFTNETGVEYNTGNFSENDKILPIQYLNSGQIIKIPQIDNNDVPTGKYITFTFDGKRYKRK